ncbi:MAG TPA: hypothetical protein VNC78_11060 [Actinomycetota bacterium]|nr:hypothetical protein [Actinomycetota bacterium]
MSSQRSDEEKPPRASVGWPPWRIVMLSASLVLLGLAVANAVIDGGLPKSIRTLVGICGYIGLAVGFGMAMRARRR